MSVINVVHILPRGKNNHVAFHLDKYFSKEDQVKVSYVRSLQKFVTRGMFIGVRSPKIINFHWINKHYLRKNFLKSILMAGVFFSLLLLFRIMGWKIVWDCHNPQPHENYHPRFSNFVRRIFCRISDHIIVLHPNMIKQLKTLYECNCPIAAACLGDYSDAASKTTLSREAARERIGIPQNTFVILSLGQIRDYKNIPMLVEGFELFLDEHPEDTAHLVLAGPVPPPVSDETKQCLSMSETNEHILLRAEHLPEYEMPVYCAASDVFAVVHSMEGVPATLYLACSYGLPLIVSRGGTKETICTEYGVGVLCDPDERSIASTIHECISSPELLEKMKNKQKIFLEQNSWGKASRTHIDVYRKVTGFLP